MKNGSPIRTLLAEARNYTPADYPCLYINRPYNETSGTVFAEEVQGADIQVSPGMDIYYTADGFGVGIDENGVTPTGAVRHNFETIPAGKFVVLITVLQLETATPHGSAAIGGGVDTPVLVAGITSGLHQAYLDDLGNSFPSAFKTPRTDLVAGSNYIVVCIFSPLGQGNLEARLYDIEGTLIEDQVIVHDGVTVDIPTGLIPAITGPFTCTYGVPGGTPGGGGGDGIGAYYYQRIIYTFNSLPSDLLPGIKWHGAAAPKGVKGPYSKWKFL